VAGLAAALRCAVLCCAVLPSHSLACTLCCKQAVNMQTAGPLAPLLLQGANILTTKEGLVKLADFGVAAKVGWPFLPP